MRLRIELDDALVEEVDRLAGPRRRSQFVRDAVALAIVRNRRWELIRRARGVIGDDGHEWDDDPAAWVHRQRHEHQRFAG